jgi:hypothetical protein
MQSPDVTWVTLKKTFLSPFRDIRTDQFHFNQLQMAKQKKCETPQEFVDRCRDLVQRTVPQTENPVLQKLYNEQAEIIVLANFTSVLAWTPGRQFSFAMPKNLERALKVTITVDQGEL